MPHGGVFMAECPAGRAGPVWHHHGVNAGARLGPAAEVGRAVLYANGLREYRRWSCSSSPVRV
jgi:hypothetical protein